MTIRAEQKTASLQRILAAGATRLRTQGLSGAGIATVMQDAGLTHGAFYVHFANKNELAVAALRHALVDNRKKWVGTLRQESWADRLKRLARRYLNLPHRDNLAQSCALSALAGEATRSEPSFRQAYEEELRKSLQGICCGNDAEKAPTPEQFDEAIAFMALCLGGLTLSRAVADPNFSERILQACIKVVGSIAKVPAASDYPQSDRGASL